MFVFRVMADGAPILTIARHKRIGALAMAGIHRDAGLTVGVCRKLR